MPSLNLFRFAWREKRAYTRNKCVLHGIHIVCIIPLHRYYVPHVYIMHIWVLAHHKCLHYVTEVNYFARNSSMSGRFAVLCWGTHNVFDTHMLLNHLTPEWRVVESSGIQSAQTRTFASSQWPYRNCSHSTVKLEPCFQLYTPFCTSYVRGFSFT